MLALLVLATFPIQPLWQVTILLFAIGLFGSSYGVLAAHARSFFPVHLTGRGVTLMNFFTIGGVGLVQFVMGQAADSNFNPVQPEQTFSLLFYVYAALTGAALLIYYFSADSKPGEN